MHDFALLIVGIAGLASTMSVFAYCMPRGEHTSRFVGTFLEPYLGVAFTVGIILSLSLILYAIVDLVV